MNEHLIQRIEAANGRPGHLGGIYRDIQREEDDRWAEIRQLGIRNWTQVWERRVREHGDSIAIVESTTGEAITYARLDELADSIAHFLRGETDEPCVGVYDVNSILYVAAVMAIGKLGRTAVLFNSADPEPRVRDLAVTYAIRYSLGRPIHGVDTVALNEIPESHNPGDLQSERDNGLEDTAFVIFTSGTSGPGKPALFNHRRMIGAGIAWSIRTAMDRRDVCYICLPLCHGNGLAIALSSTIACGATAVIRPGFSVSSFWREISRFACTHMVYIGELWSYLCNTGVVSSDRVHPLKVIFGNGLDARTWSRAVPRFGIRHVVEHYGATEMPAGALTNWTHVPGFCGFVPPDHGDWDETRVVDEDGRAVPPGTRGELVFRVPHPPYRGYLDPALDEQKLTNPDDADTSQPWWKSGDVLIKQSDGFFVFKGRLGDGYRFKGENVSAWDVEQAIQRHPEVEAAIAYGISLDWLDGQAGMASILFHDGRHDPGGLLPHLTNRLAPHAIPHFIRLETQPHATTSTLKKIKSALSAKGISDYPSGRHYVLTEGEYRILDAALLERLRQGHVRMGLGRRGGANDRCRNTSA